MASPAQTDDKAEEAKEKAISGKLQRYVPIYLELMWVGA